VYIVGLRTVGQWFEIGRRIAKTSSGMDVSADLIELGRTVSRLDLFPCFKKHGANPRVPQPIAVICAGAKSILDIPRTLEVLVRTVVLRRT
jgi:hypothetical protein